MERTHGGQGGGGQRPAAAEGAGLGLGCESRELLLLLLLLLIIIKPFPHTAIAHRPASAPITRIGRGTVSTTQPHRRLADLFPSRSSRQNSSLPLTSNHTPTVIMK